MRISGTVRPKIKPAKGPDDDDSIQEQDTIYRDSAKIQLLSLRTREHNGKNNLVKINGGGLRLNGWAQGAAIRGTRPLWSQVSSGVPGARTVCDISVDSQDDGAECALSSLQMPTRRMDVAAATAAGCAHPEVPAHAGELGREAPREAQLREVQILPAPGEE